MSENEVKTIQDELNAFYEKEMKRSIEKKIKAEAKILDEAKARFIPAKTQRQRKR